ncbi:MAG: ribosome small subunit-dependent GTPase A, partial [Bacillales bacterium]
MHEGRIVKALSGFYYVMTERKKINQCKGRGVFRKHKLTPLVGDYVVFQKVNEREGYILKVMGRKNMLVRPPISNVDQAILVFSAVEPDFSPSLLDRFLVLIEFNQIKPVICITKVDLLKPEKWDNIKKYAADYENAGYPVLLTSAKTGEGVEQVRDYLKGKISVFAGQSGVGKSSLL